MSAPSVSLRAVLGLRLALGTWMLGFTSSYIEATVSTDLDQVGLGYYAPDHMKFASVVRTWGCQQLVQAAIIYACFGHHEAENNAILAGLLSSCIHVIDSVFRVVPDCAEINQSTGAVYAAIAMHCVLIILQAVDLKNGIIIMRCGSTSSAMQTPKALTAIRYAYTKSIVFAAMIYLGHESIASNFGMSPKGQHGQPQKQMFFKLALQGMAITLISNATLLVFGAASHVKEVWTKFNAAVLLSSAMTMMDEIQNKTMVSRNGAPVSGHIVGALLAILGLWLALRGVVENNSSLSKL